MKNSTIKINRLIIRTEDIMRIYIGCDHGGYLLKEKIVDFIKF